MASSTPTLADRPFYHSLNYQRIHNAIVDIVNEGKFPVVAYDHNSGHAVVDSGVLDKPEVLCDEVGISIGASQHGRSPQDQITAWRWQAKISFANKVSVEEFVQQLLDRPIILARDDSHSTQVRIRLVSVSIQHPPRASTGSGTRVLLDLDASPSRQ